MRMPASARNSTGTFASVAEHRAYDQRLLWTRLNIGRKLEVRRWDDDSLVEDGWKTVWDARYPNSWEGRRDVNLRIAVEKPDEWHCQSPAAHVRMGSRRSAEVLRPRDRWFFRT